MHPRSHALEFIYPRAKDVAEIQIALLARQAVCTCRIYWLAVDRALVHSFSPFFGWRNLL